MAQFFRFLVETNLVTAAFVIGALTFVIAVIGSFKTIIEPSPAMRVVLAVFGLFLMGLSLASYFISSQPLPTTANAPTIGPTAISVDQPSTTIPQGVQQPSTLSKCQWLEINLPQDQTAIAAMFDLPVGRIELLKYGCENIIDGVLIRGGTNTEYTSLVEIQVPKGGCLDAPADAIFTGNYELKPWGARAYSESVKAMTMTYWAWCDELH